MLIHLKYSVYSLVFLSEDVTRIVPVLDEDGELDIYLMYLKNLEPVSTLTVEQFDELVPFLPAIELTTEPEQTNPSPGKTIAELGVLTDELDSIIDDFKSAYLPPFHHQLSKI